MADAIWFSEVELDALNSMLEHTLASTLGIRVVEIGPDYLQATMPVDDRTRQPFGILHGGASVALAETLGSLAAYLVIDPNEYVAVGLDINANHVRPLSDGIVYGRVEAVHIGRRTHVWQIHIRDGRDRLVSISRLTIAVISR